MLNGSKETASALSLSNEKRLVQSVDNDLRELSENVGSTTSGVLRDNSGPTRGSDANLCGTQILHFTGSTGRLV